MRWVKDRLKGWRTAGLLAVVVALVWLAGRDLPDGRLHVYFLDVGQGDAIFVRTPDGQQILVDGGPSPVALEEQLAGVMPFWDRSLDLVVLTHPDQDHQAGLIPVLDRYQVARVVSNPAAETQATASAWREHVARSRAASLTGTLGFHLNDGGVTLTVLSPGDRLFSGTPSDDNNNSLVMRLDYGSTAFLLTGDAEQEAEASILAAGVPLHADVLKVAHHGSRQSTSPAFVAAVSPALAVIQVGADNRFGHPHAEVIGRLRSTQVLRTDRAGRIEVVSDGRQLQVYTAR
jgi:competence protein ComEC